MKKIISLAVPILAVSLLASCNSQPTYKFTFTGDCCKINNSYSYSCDLYENTENVQYTIVADDGYKLPETIESDITYVRTTINAAIITINEIKGDISVTIKADPSLDTFTVTFDANGGELTDDTTNPVVVESTHSVKDAPKLKDRPGYDTSEVTWIDKATGEPFTFGDGGTQVTKNTIVQAKWSAINQFTVKFYDDDGTEYTDLASKVNYGDKVTYKDCPLDETYDEHYTFDGWYDENAQPFQFDKELEGDTDTPISIYAKHTKKKYHVTFDANGGEITSGGDPLEAYYLDKIDSSKRPTVTRSGYAPTTIWCTDKAGQNEFTFGMTPITDNTTLYAKWSILPITTYTVTLNAGDGFLVNGLHEMSFEFSKEMTDITIRKIINSTNSIPTLSNNTFAYYTYADKLIDYNDKVTGDDITLYAQYLPILNPYTDLDNISWETIHNVAIANPKPEICFNIGATKHVEVNGYSHLVKIIGFNHDELVTSASQNRQYAGITFEFFDLITDDSSTGVALTVWNESFENYSYSTSNLRIFLNEGEGSIFNKLPDDLKADGIIQEVYKPVAETADYTINNNYSDKLFPLSYYEMTGSDDYRSKNEGNQYPYWKDHNNNDDRKKQHAEDKSGRTAIAYWLRSPDANSQSEAWCVKNDGVPDVITIHTPSRIAVAPAFCI